MRIKLTRLFAAYYKDTTLPNTTTCVNEATVLKLLAREDQTLLVRRDTLLVLDLGLHVVDRVRGLHVQGDRLSGQSLHLGGAQGPEKNEK